MLKSMELDEPFSEQLNIRFKERTARYVVRLQALDGETKQGLFDRLVAEEYERHIIENSETMIAENQAKIAEYLAEVDFINTVVAEHQAQQVRDLV